jgi:hypothetical protein
MISTNSIIQCKDGALTFFVLQHIMVLLVDHHATETIVRPETQKYNQLTLNAILTLLWYHGVYVTPVLFDSLFFKLS